LAERLLRRGDLRLLLLALLEDGAKHGYELMRELEDRFGGLYRPSAGSVYPRLGTLVAAGLVSQEGNDYRLTAAGRAEVDGRREELRELGRRITAGSRRRGHAVRAEIRAAAAEVRAQERRVNRARRDSDVAGAARKALQVELRVFAADVMAAARRMQLDARVVGRVLRALDDARAAVLRELADN
jgi:DNA-binding PadR family transcriptional regulator